MACPSHAHLDRSGGTGLPTAAHLRRVPVAGFLRSRRRRHVGRRLLQVGPLLVLPRGALAL